MVRWPRTSYGRTRARSSFRTPSWPSSAVWWIGFSSLLSTLTRTVTYCVTSEHSHVYCVPVDHIGVHQPVPCLTQAVLRLSMWQWRQHVLPFFTCLIPRAEGRITLCSGRWAWGLRACQLRGLFGRRGLSAALPHRRRSPPSSSLGSWLQLLLPDLSDPVPSLAGLSWACVPVVSTCLSCACTFGSVRRASSAWHHWHLGPDNPLCGRRPCALRGA